MNGKSVYGEQRSNKRKLLKVKALLKIDGMETVLGRTLDVAGDGLSLEVDSAVKPAELGMVGLGVNTFDDAALQVVARAVQGNLRLCRSLCYASLVETCRDRQRIVTVSHVNAALVQPHWRSHEALLKQQAKPVRATS